MQMMVPCMLSCVMRQVVVPSCSSWLSASGLECDVSVASCGARFKSTVLRYLADIDSRFGSLVRIVKLWAGAHGMNDATAGTFNSFALTLMVRCSTVTSAWLSGEMQYCIFASGLRIQYRKY